MTNPGWRFIDLDRLTLEERELRDEYFEPGDHSQGGQFSIYNFVQICPLELGTVPKVGATMVGPNISTTADLPEGHRVSITPREENARDKSQRNGAEPNSSEAGKRRDLGYPDRSGRRVRLPDDFKPATLRISESALSPVNALGGGFIRPSTALEF